MKHDTLEWNQGGGEDRVTMEYMWEVFRAQLYDENFLFEFSSYAI